MKTTAEKEELMEQQILGHDRPTALIVGASSGIGAALAKKLVQEGFQVALLARRKTQLEELQKELNAGRPKPIASIYPHDVTNYDEIPSLFKNICQESKNLSLFVYAAGIMPVVEEQEYDFGKDRQILEINLLGAIAWLNQAAQRFSQVGGGSIVGIGSVAGERGRKGNPAYAASKAALSTYMESLRNRLAEVKTHVLTVKPGPVKTPMTDHLDKMPLAIEAEVAAEQIWQAIKERRNEAYVPAIWKPIMGIIRNIPSAVFRKMSF